MTESGDEEVQEGNSLCRQIDWDENEEFYKAWESGKTGYPFVDAIMRCTFHCQPEYHVKRGFPAGIQADIDAVLLPDSGTSDFCTVVFVNQRRQLIETGHMHHLARHMVACFLTRGDMYVSWERGRDTFDR